MGKRQEFNDAMDFLTRPSELNRQEFRKGGAVEPEIQKILNERFEGLDFDKYYYGVSPKDERYNIAANITQRKRKDSNIVFGKEALKKRADKVRSDAIKKFNDKKTDKPFGSQKLGLVKFKDAKQEEEYLKLLAEKRSQPKNVSKISNQFLADKFGITYDNVKKINSLLKDKVDSFIKGEDYYKQTGQISPTKIRDIKSGKRRRETKKKLEGNVDIGSVKESGMQTHHFMPFGGKEKTTAQGIAIIDKQMNAEMAKYETPILRNAERIEEIESQYKRSEEYPKEIQEEIKKINTQNRGYVEFAKRQLPEKYRGLIGYYEYDPTDVSAPLKKKGINPNKSIVGLKGDDFILKDNPEKTKALAADIKQQTADIAGQKELEQIKQLQSNIPTQDILQNVVEGRQAGAMATDLPLELLKGAGILGLKALGPIGTVAGTVGLETVLGYDRPIEETAKDPLTGLALLLPEAGKNVVKSARIAKLLNLGFTPKMLRAMTPVGLGIAGIQSLAQIRDIAQEIESNPELMKKVIENQKQMEKNIEETDTKPFDDRVMMAEGGKPGDKKKLPGQPDPNLPINPGRRDFMQGAGGFGLAALLAAKGFLKFAPETKSAVKAAKVSPLTKIVTPLGKTETEFPQWFPGLVDKVRKDGVQTPVYATKRVGISEAEYNKLSKEEAGEYYDDYRARTDEYIQNAKAEGKPRYLKDEKTDEIIGYEYKLENQPNLKVSEYKGENVYVEFPNDYAGDVLMEYRAPKGMKDAEFSVTDGRPVGHPDDIDFDYEYVDSVDDVLGGMSDVEKYALGSKKIRPTRGDEEVARGDFWMGPEGPEKPEFDD